VVDWALLEKQSNWIPERAGHHTKIIKNSIIKASALSRRLNTEIPSIWAVRGNTGAGKTYSISQDPQFFRALDEKGQPSGAINPDTFKAELKKETPSLTHAQLHTEGSALSYQYAETLGKEAIKATMIIDTRLAFHSDLKNSVLVPAKKRRGEALLLDIETPVITSINRVLTRSPTGEDPIVPLWAIKDGYFGIRAERNQILEEVKNNDTIQYFKLYITNEQGVQTLAAKKENGQYEVIPGMEDKVKEASEKPSEIEFNKLVNTVIDDKYIEEART
jgi:hypothetical protein